MDEKGRITAYKYDDAGRLAEVLYPFKSGKVASDFDERLSLGLFPQFESGVPTQTGNPKLNLGFTMPQVPGFDESGFEADLQGSLDGEDAIAKAYLGMAQQAGGDWKVTPGDGATPFTKQLAPTGTEPAMIQAAAIRANGRNTSIDINPYLWDETYSYDSRNNRTAKANGWGRIDYSYDAENRLTGAGKRTYSNDANGNLIEEALGNIKAEYEYDFENRAVDVYSQMAGFVGKGRGSAWSLQAGVRYEYDAFGRRVTRTEYDTITRGQKREREWNATTATDYLYDGLSMNLLAEAVDGNFRPDDLALPYQPWNGDANRPGNGPSKPWPSSRSNYFAWSDRFHPMSEYEYGNNEILERVDFDTAHYSSAVKASAQYYELDALGLVMMTTGPGGDVRDRYEYDAYGQAFEGSFRRINDLGYNGKRTDPTTGLVDYGFRDYAPKLGRFTTSDPIQAGLNWYAYVNNDPMNSTDPTGLRLDDTAESGREAGVQYHEAQERHKERESEAEFYQLKQATDYAMLLRASVGESYQDLGECNGSVLNPLREMGYNVPEGYNADDIAKGKVQGIAILPDVEESRQGEPGIINAYDWDKNGIVDHVNAGVGQLSSESKPQVFDATENDALGVNKKWTTGRNNGMPGNGQDGTAVPGQGNLTYVPFSNNTKPTVQLQIDFNLLQQKYGDGAEAGE